MRKASVLFEFILMIVIVSTIYTMFYHKTNKNKFQQLESKITQYLKQNTCQNYNIRTIDISCNSTDSLGQISFGNDGRVYSKLSNYANEQYNYEIKTPCKIRFIAHNNEFFEIKISPKTGFIE